MAFVYGSFARSTEQAKSDVDLMVIGKITLSELAPVLRRLEHQLGRSVNPNVYTAREFAMKLASGHHFVNSVLSENKIFIQGDKNVLETITELTKDKSSHNK